MAGQAWLRHQGQFLSCLCTTIVAELFAVFSLQGEFPILPQTPLAAANEDTYCAVSADQFSVEFFVRQCESSSWLCIDGTFFPSSQLCRFMKVQRVLFWETTSSYRTICRKMQKIASAAMQQPQIASSLSRRAFVMQTRHRACF
jgi:hypothetical protein